jgi:hypothetical protein
MSQYYLYIYLGFFFLERDDLDGVSGEASTGGGGFATEPFPLAAVFLCFVFGSATFFSGPMRSSNMSRPRLGLNLQDNEKKFFLNEGGKVIKKSSGNLTERMLR